MRESPRGQGLQREQQIVGGRLRPTSDDDGLHQHLELEVIDTWAGRRSH